MMATVTEKIYKKYIKHKYIYDKGKFDQITFNWNKYFRWLKFEFVQQMTKQKKIRKSLL